MGALRRLLMSSIGKKYVMGLSGLLLMGFVVAHLAGNLLVFQGDDAFNAYAAKLHSLGPLLWLAEIGLVLLFGLHILYAYWLAAENRASRGDERYEVSYKSKQRTTFLNLAPRSWMAISGSIVLAFLVLHMIDMRFGLRDKLDPSFDYATPLETEDESGREKVLMYERVIDVLRTPLSFAVYTVGTILLGFHLSHGASSWFRSVGLETYGLGGPLKKIGVALAVAVGLGFASIPLYVWIADVKVGDASQSEADRVTEDATDLDSADEIPGGSEADGSGSETDGADQPGD